jgi:peptidoglycan/LPS O-acetylase OafA/YrhL
MPTLPGLQSQTNRPFAENYQMNARYTIAGWAPSGRIGFANRLKIDGAALNSTNENAQAAVFHLGYRRWLDGLRGVAILLVLAFHLSFIAGGSLGVDIFFVLSGFLITSLLVEEWQRRGSISLKRFYFRRALRLLPAFATLLGLYALYALLQPANERSAILKEIAVAGCYIANWPHLHQTGLPLLGHTWSLSLEEQFYLLWPLLLVAMLWARLSHRRVLQIVCAGIVACVVLRNVLYNLHDVPGPAKGAYIIRLYMGLDTRADTLLVGCMVGLLAAWNLLPNSRRFVHWTGVASLISVAALSYISWNKCLDHSQFYRGLFTLVALMVGVILVRLLVAPSRLAALVLEWPPLVGIGRISYAIYLYHIPFQAMLRPENHWRFPAAPFVVAGLSLAAAIVSYYCVERPCLRLKDRLQELDTVQPVSANFCPTGLR